MRGIKSYEGSHVTILTGATVTCKAAPSAAHFLKVNKYDVS